MHVTLDLPAVAERILAEYDARTVHRGDGVHVSMRRDALKANVFEGHGTNL